MLWTRNFSVHSVLESSIKIWNVLEFPDYSRTFQNVPECCEMPSNLVENS